MSTTTQILFNSPALHSLKHDQLVDLCKIHSVKHSGKRADLVERLQQHARALPIRDSGAEMDSDMCSYGRLSDAWETLEAIEEVEEQPSRNGTLSSMKSWGVSEFGTGPSKSNSVSSSIRAFASSLGINKSTTNQETKENHPEKHGQPLNKVERQPQPHPTHHTFSMVAVNPDHSLSSDYDELPGEGSRKGLPVKEGARLSLTATPSGATTTVRLVTNTTPFDPSFSPTPQLRPFVTTFDLELGTPTKDTTEYESIYPRLPTPPFPPTEASSIYSRLPTPPFPPSDGETREGEMEVDMPGGFGSPEATPPPPKETKPFVFGSPRPSDATFNFTSPGGARLSVLEEMNQRLAQQGVEGMTTSIFSQPKTSSTTAPARPSDSSTYARYDTAHEAEFDKMESIATWASKRGRGPDKPGAPAVGAKRKSSALEDPAQQPKKTRTSIKATEEADDNRRLSKKARVSVVEDVTTQDTNKEKEREAVKRMLDKNKAQRRSSMGVNGRTSLGKAPPAKPKSRFGFLSSAKNLVKSVFGKGQSSKNKNKANDLPPDPEPVKKSPAKKPSLTSTNPPPKPQPTTSKASIASKPAPNVRPPIPTFATNPVSPPPKIEVPAPSSESSTVGSRKSTLNQRTSGLAPRPQPRKVSAELKPRVRVSGPTTSRLLAPTASSLAKKQSLGEAKPVKPIVPTPKPIDAGQSRIPVRTPSPGPSRIFSQPLQSPLPRMPSVPLTSPSSKMDEADGKLEEGSADLARKPSGRKPRISRSKVIAKLASKRAATTTIQPNGKTRSSMGAAAAGGKQTSHGASRQSDVMASAKKRARQSEYNRRRSKGAAPDAGKN